MIELVLLVLS